jgi:hypothetical protein
MMFTRQKGNRKSDPAVIIKPCELGDIRYETDKEATPKPAP